MDNKLYYVYEIIDPRDNNIIYVGKGKNNRYLVHINICKLNKKPINNKLNNKLKQILNCGLQPTYNFLKTFILESEAYDFEQKIINEYGKENLCNLKDGGTNGAIFSDEVKIKMSLSHKKRWSNYTLEQKNERNKKISKAKKGVHRSEETKLKLHNNLIGLSFIDRFGVERARDIKNKISLNQSRHCSLDTG